MEETKKMEQPEMKMIKVTVDGHDGHMEYEGTAVLVLAMKDDPDEKGVLIEGKTEGWFSGHYLMAMQKILEENFPNWNKVNIVRMTGKVMEQMYGKDEDEEGDTEAPKSDPAE